MPCNIILTHNLPDLSFIIRIRLVMREGEYSILLCTAVYTTAILYQFMTFTMHEISKVNRWYGKRSWSHTTAVIVLSLLFVIDKLHSIVLRLSHNIMHEVVMQIDTETEPGHQAMLAWVLMIKDQNLISFIKLTKASYCALHIPRDHYKNVDISLCKLQIICIHWV